MNKYERISCHHFIEVNEYVYFSNWFYNGLFRVRLKTGEAMFLGAFEKEVQDEFNVHWELIRLGDLIYFFPRRGRHIHIFSLADRSITAIEIRKASENFFRFGEVLVEKKKFIFLPIEENAPIRQFDLNTWHVTDVPNTRDFFGGIHLSQSRKSFPNLQILEKYQIELADKFSWKQTKDGKWYAFLPFGRHLLWYMPETQKIETVPLVVVNERELETYLQPMRQQCLSQRAVIEDEQFSLPEYLKIIIKYEGSLDNKHETKQSDRQNIWRFIKN